MRSIDESTEGARDETDAPPAHPPTNGNLATSPQPDTEVEVRSPVTDGDGHLSVPHTEPVVAPLPPTNGSSENAGDITTLPTLPTRARVAAPAAEVKPEKKPGLFRRAIGRIGESWIWRARGFWLGFIAICLAIYGQKLVTVDRDILGSIRWYGAGIILMLIAWTATYKNKTGLVVPAPRVTGQPATLPTRTRSRRNGSTALAETGRGGVWKRLGRSDASEPGPIKARWRAATTRYPIIAGPWPRYLLALIALALNLWSANEIRQNYFSVLAGWTWFGSMGLLALAFVRERKRGVQDLDAARDDIEERTDLRFPRRVEFLLVAGIIMMALVFRFYRLGDWFTGMHGDEGEAGMDATNIREGARVSLFETGWFQQPNMYYYGIARMLDIFGTDLFGVRMFSTLVGSAMLVPFYLLARMWFGVRAGLIALTFLAISGVAFHFTRVEFSNITWPVSLVFGFYFLTRGLKTKRTLDFILSAYSFMFLSLYFYNGGRLTPFLVAAVLGYLFLIAPALRLPEAYGELRRLTPGLGRGRAWLGALKKQSLSVLHYFPQVLIFLVACLCSASAFLVYYFDHRDMLDARARDKIVFNNEGSMAAIYGRTHEPLYVGLRWPRPEDVYPISPVVFEQTPLSIKVMDDGFWPRILWDQTTRTLSILTYREDASSVYTFTRDAVAKPIEAALIILGLALAAWRWRDSRMAIISMWFWSAVLAGGVATTDAPYMARMAGLIPALALLAMLPVNKIAAELTGATAGFRFRMPSVAWRRLAGQVAGMLGIVALLTYLSFQNWNDYYGRYLGQVPLPFSDVTGQSYFVRQMNNAALAEGKPTPKYYNLGTHFIYWTHGDNRFLNHGTDGIDMVNPTNELPVLDSENRDIYFMVWGNNRHYLDTIRAYYPEGTQEDYNYGPPGKTSTLFTYYKVSREQLAARRGSVVTYSPLSGVAVRRDEPGLGTTLPPPEEVSYPARAVWETQLVAPAFGRYRLNLEAPAEATLTVDGQGVITTTASARSGEIELLLARGPHQVTVAAALSSPTDKVEVKWAAGTPKIEAIPRHFLYNGDARALYAVITPHSGLPVTQYERPASGDTAAILGARVDGFIGFRSSDGAIGSAGEATWRGTIELGQPGTYLFDMVVSAPAAIFIDGRLVASSEAFTGMAPANVSSGPVELTAGSHTVEVRVQVGSSPYIEVFVTPPGGSRTMLGLNTVNAQGGIVDPSRASEPPPVQLGPEPQAQVLRPLKILGGSGRLNNPRGLGVDDEGNVYVGDRGNGRIVVYSPGGEELRTWGKSVPEGTASTGPGEFIEISDVAVGADGTVYVMDIKANKLQAFTREGQHRWSVDNAALQASNPNGIGVAPDGSTYIAVVSNNKIVKVPPTTDRNVVGATSHYSGGEALGPFDQPVDVAPDPSDPTRFYAIDLRNRIVQFNEEGTILRQWTVTIGLDDGASRMAVSGDGSTLYITDPDRNRVSVLNLTDGSTEYFGATGSDEGQFLGMSGIALGPDGNIYVLDRRNNRVQVFAP
jgi:sugar lactone lactonase YvrE